MSSALVKREELQGEGEPLNRRARLRQRRRERLLAVLPRIYAQQPAGSVVSVLVDAMAARLAELDEAIERVLRDRWVALAGGTPPFDALAQPLEGLARLLGLESEPWERAEWTKPDGTKTDWEAESAKVERFRRRVRQSAPVLTRGSTSVRSVLTLCAAALDTELCPRLVRLPLGSATPDTTLGLGVRPGTRACCPGCANPGAAERCVWDTAEEQPEASAATRSARQTPLLARMLLTDNPPTPRSQLFAGLTHGQTFRVRNSSLVRDRPEVWLEALTDLSYPALQNLGNKGTLLFAGKLEQGQALILRPKRLAQEVAPFEGSPTEGSAHVRKADGGLQDVSAQIFFLEGNALFDASRFAGDEEEDPRGTHFAELRNEVLSPWVEPGEVTWAYQGFTQTDVPAAEAEKLGEWFDGMPQRPDAGRVDITLQWWTRPPATFRLRIPQVPVIEPELRGAVLELVRRSVERARAASVQVSVDFPEPPHRERHKLRECPPSVQLTAPFTEGARLAEQKHEVSVSQRQPPEQQPLGEGTLAPDGIFDVTRLDGSRFAP